MWAELFILSLSFSLSSQTSELRIQNWLEIWFCCRVQIDIFKVEKHRQSFHWESSPTGSLIAMDCAARWAITGGLGSAIMSCHFYAGYYWAPLARCQKNCDLQGAERGHSVLINPNIICSAAFGYSAQLDGGSLFLSSRVSRVSLSTALVFAWYRVELAGVSPLFHQSFLELTLAFDFRVLLMIGHICAPAFRSQGHVLF